MKKSRQMALNGHVDLQTAAEDLGVHYQTAYRWVREGTLRAVKQGVMYVVEPDEVERFRQRRERPTPPPARRAVRDWAPHVDRLYEALVVGDEPAARQLIDRLRDSGINVVDLCQRLFTPSLQRIGDSWARGRVTLADEHRASGICGRLLARVATHPRGRPRGTAVIATVPGEAHELPGTMAAMALRADRWRVHHLGTQVPYDQLAALAKRDGADTVVLSVTDTHVEREARRYGERVESELHLRVLVGRPGAELTELLEQARR
jgi:excisionase family DNA binding protein